MKPICNLILIFLLLIECNLKMMQMEKDFFSQKIALLKLYQSTNGMNWHPCNWADKLNENPCGWCGIYCRKNTTEVIGIELMENNLIGEINDSISDLIYLKEMRLSGNNISALPSSLSHLNLTLLWVQNNTITDVSLIAWSNFGFLTDLRIFRNPIQSIPNSLFFLPIVRLDLSFTEISSFPNQIYSKSTIKQILAHNNNLGPSFPQVLCSIEKIEMIDLSYNQILQIEGDIFECGNLKSLFLSNNFIQFLPQFDGGSLDILDLSFNNISFVVDSFKNVEINKLIVSDNTIEVITPPKSITSLSAQNNSIQNVSLLYPFFNSSSFSFMDVSFNKLKGSFDTNFQNGFINLIGNRNVSFNHYIFGEPSALYQDPFNQDSVYQCKSVYSDPLFNSIGVFDSVNNLQDLYKIEIYPQFFNYTNCKCAEGYYV